MVYRMLMGEIMLIGIFVFDVYMLIYLFDQKYEFIFLLNVLFWMWGYLMFVGGGGYIFDYVYFKKIKIFMDFFREGDGFI